MFIRYYEIFVNTPLDVCEARDVKGLYKKARDGLISGFTGVSQDYEIPQNPDLVVTTVNMSIQDSTNRLIDFLEDENIIPKNLREIEVVSVHHSISNMVMINISNVFIDSRIVRSTKSSRCCNCRSRNSSTFRHING